MTAAGPVPVTKTRSPLLAIFLIVAVDILGLTIILPLLPFYAERFGASPQTVGLLVTSYAFFQLISGPLLGQISDRTGRKPMLLISQLGTFIGFIVLARATALWVVFLSRIIDGVTAGNLSLAQAYISDVTKPENRAKSFAVIGIAFGLGFLVGPGISGYLSQFGFQTPIYAAAGLSLTSILATFFMLPARPERPRIEGEAENAGPAAPGGPRLGLLQWKSYARFFRDPVLSPLLVQFMLFFLYFSIFITGFALFAERRFVWNGMPFGPKQVGYVYAYVGFLGILLQGGLIGRLVARFGEARLVRAGFLSALVGYGILGFVHSLPGLLLAATISSFGNGAIRPALTSLITRHTSRHEQGVVLGLTQSLNSVAAIVCPIVAGFLIDHGLLSGWAWLASVIALGGYYLTLKARTTAQPGVSAQATPVA